jgi:predicted ATPase/class 3 adenylate cyclase
MFTDIEGSTRLARTLGSDYRPVLGEHRKVLRRILSEKDGAELFTEGDSFFVAFADASAALDACLSAQRALAGHDWPVPDSAPLVRMGLHTGLAEPFGGEYASAEVHRAARVAAAAHGGQVLCSAATARHAGTLPPDAALLDLGLHRLRGFDDSERLFQLVAPGLQVRFPRPRTPRAAAHNLPAQLTSFVGRRAERAELTALLARHRLVTVVGAAGSGKTRLAVELAATQLGSHPDGVWLVDVAALDSTAPEAIAAAVATAIGVRPEPHRPIIDTLRDHLAGARLLLLLDTCDADPYSVAAVATGLLATAPGLRVLAIGREPLAVAGELVWRIPTLATRPAPDGGPGDAVRLLAERAEAARGGRPATPAELADLHRVAARLDGLPLALELAATRLRLLSTAQLAARLDDVLAVLDAGRAHLPAPATASPAPATASPAPATASPAPATASPALATAEPARANGPAPVPATALPPLATAEPAPATGPAPVPAVTPDPVAAVAPSTGAAPARRPRPAGLPTRSTGAALAGGPHPPSEVDRRTRPGQPDVDRSVLRRIGAPRSGPERLTVVRSGAGRPGGDRPEGEGGEGSVADRRWVADTGRPRVPQQPTGSDRQPTPLRAARPIDRHATMRAAVHWSYRTLPPAAARLLSRLATFAGPVDLSAVEWLAEADPLDPLAVLVDKSLVQADPAATGTRYRLLGPIRAYAADRLAAEGDEAGARDRHAAWVAHQIDAAQRDPDGRPATLSLHDLAPVVPEARAALRWSVSAGPARPGLGVVTALGPWWPECGEPGEARRWLRSLYARAESTGEQVPAAELVEAYLVHAAQAGADGEPEERLQFCRQAGGLLHAVPELSLRGRVLAARGPALAGLGRSDDAEQACREAVRWAARHRLPGAVLPAVTCLAELLCGRGRLDEAADLLGAARPAEAGEPRERGRRTVDMLLGLVALRRGDLVAAHDHLVVALRSRMRHGFRRLAAETVAAMAARCAAGGDPVAAATLFGAVGPRAGWPAQQAVARAAAGDAAFDAAYADGAALDLDAAVAFALRVEHPDLAAGSTRFSAA